MTDEFKYGSFACNPTSTGDIIPSKKGSKYSVSFDTANDISVSFYRFSKAYFFAANIIVHRMLEKQYIDELDSYFFPVFFLYRHSIELLLKSIACTKIKDQIDRITFFKTTFHDLESILNYIISNKIFYPNADELRWMLDYFHNIAVFDKESDSFRYPYHIKMQKNILNFKEYKVLRVFEKQTHIDLIGEAKKMSAAYEILANLYDSIINVKPCFISSKFRQCNSTFLNEDGGYYEQSVVGYEYNNRNFYSYCRGYLECANLLKQYLTDKYDKGAYCPYLVYPMFYLYRNNIELQLKSMIFDCSELDIQERCAVVFENKHKILKLFAFIEDKILPFYSISKTDPFIVNSKRYCEILHRFDSDSGRFRYPVNKKYNPYQKNKQYYSFIEIGDFLESLCNAIDGIHSEIEQRAEFLSEMRVENSNYY